MTFKHNLIEKTEIETKIVDNKRHYVTPEGNVYPSVTTVISMASDKTFLEKWKQRVGEDVVNATLKQATNRGTHVHSLFEKYLMNEEIDYRRIMPIYTFMFKQLKPWLDKNVNLVYGIELPLYSDILKTAGRTDLFAQVNEINSILDYKTSAKEKNKEWIENYFIQSTVYALMIEERYNISVPQIVIVIASESGDPQIFIEKTENYKNKVYAIFNQYSYKI